MPLGDIHLDFGALRHESWAKRVIGEPYDAYGEGEDAGGALRCDRPMRTRGKDARALEGLVDVCRRCETEGRKAKLTDARAITLGELFILTMRVDCTGLRETGDCF